MQAFSRLTPAPDGSRAWPSFADAAWRGEVARPESRSREKAEAASNGSRGRFGVRPVFASQRPAVWEPRRGDPAGSGPRPLSPRQAAGLDTAGKYMRANREVRSRRPRTGRGPEDRGAVTAQGRAGRADGGARGARPHRTLDRRPPPAGEASLPDSPHESEGAPSKLGGHGVQAKDGFGEEEGWARLVMSAVARLRRYRAGPRRHRNTKHETTRTKTGRLGGSVG